MCLRAGGIRLVRSGGHTILLTQVPTHPSAVQRLSRTPLGFRFGNPPTYAESDPAYLCSSIWSTRSSDYPVTL